MAKRTSTHPDPDKEYSDLQRRLFLSITQIQLAAQQFEDLSDFPEDHVHAAVVTQEAANDLDRIYNELDSWYVRHEHGPKKGVRS